MGIDFHRGETRLFLGLYEAELNRHLREIAKPGRRAFDIGGQYGYDALVLAKLTGARVLSVECDPLLAQEIRENAGANPALAPVDVEVSFLSDEESATSTTIDGLAERHFVPDLIKMDIEGGEARALKGARRVLDERKPALLLEVHGKDIERSCLDVLRRAGYQSPTVVERRRWLPEHRPIQHNRWLIFKR